MSTGPDYRACVERAPLGIFVADSMGRFVEVNPAGCRLLGCSEAEVLAQGIPDILHPEDLEAGLQAFREVLDSGYACSQHRFVRADQSVIHMGVVAARLSEDRFAAFCQDVTEHVEALEALRDSEKTARAFINTPLSTVMLLAPDGRVLDCNATAAARFHMSPEQLIGQCIWSLLPPGAIDARKVRALEMLHAKQPIRFTDERDGIWFDNYVYPFLNEAGQVLKVALIAHDVTELKRSETKLQEAFEDLAQTNTKLTDALAQAEQMLIAVQARSTAQSEFLASITHEIRTPMNAILGFTQLLLESSSLADEQRECLGGIRSASGQLLTIVDDVLQMAKLESGKVGVAAEPSRLSELIGLLEVAHLPRAVAKGIGLLMEVSPLLPDILVLDGKKLYRILSNLLDNAIKFTSQGEVRLSLSPSYRGADPMRLGAMVSDTGPGIDKAEQLRLFEPFSQGKSGSARGGTGLGLAICRELARLMGGSIALSSDVGAGCRFTVEIPVSLPDSDSLRFGLSHTMVEEPSFLAARLASYLPAIPPDDGALAGLANLPREMRHTLLNAALAARQNTISDIARDLEAASPRLAGELYRIARSFDYQRIVDWLGEESMS